MLPNLLLVGAMKSGTTSLAGQLGGHPEIFMSTPKEPRFFDENWERGLDWYRALFAGADAPVVAEASTTYTMHPHRPHVGQRIAATLDPAALRLLYIVRHPLDRIISHYQHEWYEGRITTSLDRAVDAHPILLDYSRYEMQTAEIARHCPAARWIFVVFEDFKTEPHRVLAEIFTQLGVDPSFQPEDTSARNVTAGKRRRSTISGAIRRVPLLAGLVRAVLPQRLRGRLGRLGGRTLDRPTFSPDVRERVLRELTPDLQAFSTRVGRDLLARWELSRKTAE